MHEQHAHERERHADRDSDPRTSPSSSRMLANFLADIELLLDEQRWEAALREALDLPNMAVALEDPQLRSSATRVQCWCDKWIRSAEADGGPESRGDVRRIVCERAQSQDLAQFENVPASALRRLRLRRLARMPPRGFKPERHDATDPAGAYSVEVCTALVEASRRWYAHSACHDATVQANLARLAVLR